MTWVETAPLVNGLSYESAPVARATRLVGSAVLKAKVRVSSETMHLTPAASGLHRVAAGHRIGLRAQSSNTVWALPGNPGTVDIAEGALKGVARGSSLKLPTIGSQARFG